MKFITSLKAHIMPWLPWAGTFGLLVHQLVGIASQPRCAADLFLTERVPVLGASQVSPGLKASASNCHRPGTACAIDTALRSVTAISVLYSYCQKSAAEHRRP